MEMTKISVVCFLLLALVLAYGNAVCVHNGIAYKEGETFIDDCNTCKCGQNGNSGCNRKACPPKVCNYNGKMYGAGEQFMDAEGCNRCKCTETGLAACTMKLCI